MGCYSKSTHYFNCESPHIFENTIDMLCSPQSPSHSHDTSLTLHHLVFEVDIRVKFYQQFHDAIIPNQSCGHQCGVTVLQITILLWLDEKHVNKLFERWLVDITNNATTHIWSGYVNNIKTKEYFHDESQIETPICFEYEWTADLLT